MEPEGHPLSRVTSTVQLESSTFKLPSFLVAHVLHYPSPHANSIVIGTTVDRQSPVRPRDRVDYIKQRNNR
jgi:hypothetical protein